jgi:tryptophan synthase beta subunit
VVTPAREQSLTSKSLINDYLADISVVTITRPREVVDVEVIGGESQFGLAIDAASCFVNDKFLLMTFDRYTLGSQLNPTAFPTLVRRCSKKQRSLTSFKQLKGELTIFCIVACGGGSRVA